MTHKTIYDERHFRRQIVTILVNALVKGTDGAHGWNIEELYQGEEKTALTVRLTDAIHMWQYDQKGDVILPDEIDTIIVTVQLGRSTDGR